MKHIDGVQIWVLVVSIIAGIMGIVNAVLAVIVTWY